MARVVATCKKHNVPVGHPHVDGKNAERILGEGFRYLMTSAGRSYASLDKARELAKR
jgi:4-hydroxy-2-oxoheptanedioate aldolase